MLLITAFLLFAAQAGLFAQMINVKGTVRSADGASVPGINITVKGTKTVSVTGSDGRYAINAPSAGTLVFSSIGYENIEVPIAGRTQVDITIRESVSNISEVVVVG